MLLLCMSAAGTIPTIICIILFLWKKRNFSFDLGRWLILSSVVLYLLPFQVIKYLFPASCIESFDLSLHMDYFDGFEKSMVFSVGDRDYWIPDTVIILEIIWLFLIVIFSITQFVLYEYRVFNMKRYSEEIKIEVRDMGQQKVYVTDGIDTPYTVGFFRPFIIIPRKLLTEESLDLVYRHEYTHLKKHDSLVKLICLITFCIHWFNPLALANLFLYERFAELLADSEAVKNSSETSKKEYIKFMIKMAAQKDKMPIVWKNNFFTTRKMMEWRIQVIMKNKPKRKIITSLLTIVISIILSSTTIMAYTPLQSSSGPKEITSEENDFVQFEENKENISEGSITDEYFISDDNEIYPIVEQNNNSEKALCIHEFVDGQLSRHVSNDSGGCTMYVYDAKKCKKCNYLVVYDLIYSTTYVKCPHDF